MMNIIMNMMKINITKKKKEEGVKMSILLKIITKIMKINI